MTRRCRISKIEVSARADAAAAAAAAVAAAAAAAANHAVVASAFADHAIFVASGASSVVPTFVIVVSVDVHADGNVEMAAVAIYTRRWLRSWFKRDSALKHDVGSTAARCC